MKYIQETIDCIRGNRFEELDLGNKQITDEDMKVLAEALKVNKSLKNVYLYDNKITDEGTIALAEALKVNQTLRCLSLENNKITQKGLLALVESLKINNNIRTLELHAIDIGYLIISSKFIKLINNK